MLNISRLFERHGSIHTTIEPRFGSITEFEIYPNIDFYFKIDIAEETKSPV